jgi:hypothetical protein
MEGTETEKIKLIYDYLKQIATVSTGSTLLIVAFVEKLFTNPQWKWLIAVSLTAFTMTTALSLVLQFMLVQSFDPETKEFGLWGAYGFILMSIIFLGGILSLVIFALRNFF